MGTLFDRFGCSPCKSSLAPGAVLLLSITAPADEGGVGFWLSGSDLFSWAVPKTPQLFPEVVHEC